MASNKSVIVKGGSYAIREEFTASGAITPGHVLMVDSADKVKVQATANAAVRGLVALENDVIGNDIDDAYASGDRVQCVWMQPGMCFNGLLADGESVAKGDLLEVNAAGELIKQDADTSVGTVIPGSVIFMSRQTLDLSGSSGADPSSRRLLVQRI